ncbi:uncharacterized protein LOC121734723 [Aricia agestis]|uniref:uncharacterized protein LOC121734723 n=1 Tax=Aricia agestis TaxID=91739 RepID=UPI001C204E54|nr:uncharacterized protein LOC121734723 [Aricia agestis]
MNILWTFDSMLRVLFALGIACTVADISEGVDFIQNTENDTQTSALEATNTSSFDCKSYTSCTQCVSSPSPCDWCIDGHRCTHDTEENCRNDILVTGISRIGPSYRSGPSFCPILKSTFGDTNEILVPYGAKKAIKVRVHIVGQFIVQTRFVCQFKIEGKIIRVNAQLLADTIYCDHVEWTYTSHPSNKTASFDVIWGGSKPLDNPYNIHVVIYNCNGMADDCGNCLELADKFGCGWCQGSNRCELQDQCGAQNNWLDRTQTCPKTEIDIQNPALEANNNSSFVECNAYTSCTQCVSSPYPCDWCVDGQRCTHDTAENCRNDILVTGVSRTGPSFRSGPSFCPTLNSTFDDTNEILVPFGAKKAIKVRVHIVGQFIVQTRFVCQFKIEGKIIHVNAQLLADTIYCDHVEWTYTSHAPNITASFDVIWGGTKPLDNPNNIHVVIYSCNGMAVDCGNCLELADKFGCGWCQGSNRCELQDQCGAQNNWLDRTQTCPKTEIDIQNPALEANNNSSFVECNAYTSCTQCVSSPYPCDWCVDGHRCTHDTAENCRNDILVTGVSRVGPSYRSGPSFCPTLKSTYDDTNEILVPFGVKKAIKVKVHIIGQFIVQTRFVCQFKLESKIIHVNAQLLADTIYCDRVEWTYTSQSPNVTASFDVIWGGSKPLDNPNNIHLLIYKCNGMAGDCEKCLKLADRFDCGWCQGSNRCNFKKQCDAQSIWLDRNQTCPRTE